MTEQKLTTPAAAIRILCIAQSSNAKTGNIAQTYSSANTCPDACTFKTYGGCYGQGYYTLKQWNRTAPEAPARDNVRTPETLREWIERNTAIGALIRHNVCGDICRPETSDINPNLIVTLSQAFKGRRAYTYTHARKTAKNFEMARRAARRGFVINFSCERIEDADRVIRAGLPAVLAVPAPVEKGAKTPAGNRLIQCPAQTHENINCANCALCARAGRKTIVCFAAHGNKKTLAIKAIEAANK